MWHILPRHNSNIKDRFATWKQSAGSQLAWLSVPPFEWAKMIIPNYLKHYESSTFGINFAKHEVGVLASKWITQNLLRFWGNNVCVCWNLKTLFRCWKLLTRRRRFNFASNGFDLICTTTLTNYATSKKRNRNQTLFGGWESGRCMRTVCILATASSCTRRYKRESVHWWIAW